MAGTKLIEQLRQEINHYLGIPYYSNTQKLAKGNVYVGKGNWQEIRSISSDYKFLKKNNIGIDCSGLICHLLNFYLNSKLDVRKTSADMLTSHPISQQINSLDQVQTGDLIRLDGGKHVLFIVERVGDTIHYVHSSDRTKIRGVHLGTITIIDPRKNLNQQVWSDQTLSGQPYSSLFNPADGDGVFRLKFLTSLPPTPDTSRD